MADSRNGQTEQTVVGESAFIGTRIGNYEVKSLLGRGGFGSVYKAHDVKLGRDVALKFLTCQFDESAERLFEREAKAIAALSKHQYIVDIYEWGEYEGRAYFALECVETSLKGLLKEFPDGMPVKTAIQIVLECAEGLAYAHERGVIHRDIKPPNILIDSDGCTKIVDFGLARLYESSEESRSGLISGSPSYMSPEQASGRRVDHKTDIFSLGVTFYELLCGRRMFGGKTVSETLECVRKNEHIPLRQCKADLPEAVLRVVEHATALKPEKRFQSAEEMAESLRDILSALEGGVEPTPLRFPTSSKVQALRWTALAVGAVILAVMLPLAWDGSREPGYGISALAQANTMLDHGDLMGAEQLYRKYLPEAPNEDVDKAHYGLGYSLLLQGNTAGSAAEFGNITDEMLRAEGEAAVAYHSKGESAREILEAAVEKVITKYPETLIAALDIAAEDYQSALERLQLLDHAKFNFGWQRAQHLQRLGRAYYHTGDYEKARDVFSQIGDSASPMTAAVARAYSERIGLHLDGERRARIVNTAQDIRQKMDEAGHQQLSEEELWHSRPIRFYTLPADPGRSRLAADSGLADVLPWILGNALASTTPMDQVGRDMIEEILAEQQMSAYLSSGTGQLRLGQVQGARLIIKCKFQSLNNEDMLLTDVQDTETTVKVASKRISVLPHVDPDMLAEDLAGKIWQEVADKYPIQGHLQRSESGPEIDIGLSVGVKEGMRFQVCSQPNTRYVQPGKVVVVEGPVGSESAAVRLEGFESIPEGGLYVTIEQTES
jgi:tetratricopeptide (TPR) repeat protein